LFGFLERNRVLFGDIRHFLVKFIDEGIEGGDPVLLVMLFKTVIAAEGLAIRL
jgi:hypothetical protein